MKPLFVSFFLLSLLLFCNINRGLAQGEYQFIVLSGVIIDGVEADPVPGVNVYVPKAGKGTSTNYDGFFAMQVLPGDSIIISAVGYKKQYYIMPYRESSGYSVVIELKQDTTLLPIVEVFPYPTEELFKEAFIAMELPDEERMQRMRENLNKGMMTSASYNLAMDGAMNYRYFMMQDAARIGNRNTYPSFSFLNPFAWAEFFKSVKRGDFKKDKWKGR